MHSEDSRVGSLVDGRYLILSLIEKGERAVVYKAKHQLMGRLVAIKFLQLNLEEDKSGSKRFSEEAKALALLLHPNLVAIHDSGIGDESQPFLVMDFVEGESLRTVIEKATRVETERAVGFFLQICDGLIHAHQKGIIHRDLKPESILLSQNGGGAETARIVDFGIAKLTAGSSQKLTQTGAMVGSPIYRSPEQWIGRTPDARSDIYSFGCIMYEALTGMPPFPSDRLLEVMLHDFDAKPKPIREMMDYIKASPALEAVVAKALERHPEQRYQSIALLKKDLAATPEAQQVLKNASASGAAHPLSISARLNLSAKTLVTAAATLLIFGCAVFFFARSQTGALAIANMSLALFEMGGKSNDPHILDLLNRLVDLYSSAGKYDKAVEYQKRIVQIVVAQYGPGSDQAVKAYDKRADVLCKAGRYDEAAEQYKKDINYIADHYGKASLILAFAWERLADIYAHQNSAELHSKRMYGLAMEGFVRAASQFNEVGQVERAKQLYLRVLSDAEKSAKPLLEAEAVSVVQALQKLGDMNLKAGNYAEAINLFIQSLSETESQLSADNGAVLAAVKHAHDCAEVLVREKRYSRAEPLYEALLSCVDKKCGPDDLIRGEILYKIAKCLMLQVEPPINSATNKALVTKAEPLCRKGIESFKKKGNYESSDYIRLTNYIGRCKLVRGDYAEALKYCEEMIRMRESNFDLTHPDVLYEMSKWSTDFCSLGRMAECKLLCRQTLAMAQRLDDAGSYFQIPPLAELADAEYSSGNKEEAGRCADQAVKVMAQNSKIWSRPSRLDIVAYLRPSVSILVEVSQKLGRDVDAQKLKESLSELQARL